MNAGNYLFRFDVVQSTGRDDEGWITKLPCQTQTGSVHIPESEVEAQATSAEMLPRFWPVLRHSHAIAPYPHASGCRYSTSSAAMWPGEAYREVWDGA